MKDMHKLASTNEDAMNEEEKWRLMFKCYDALIILLEGNHNQALAKIQDLCKHHSTSAIVHRCYAEILARTANELDHEHDELQRRRDEAITEARTAVSLAPDDAEMARFLARMLFSQAKTREDFEEVSRICETVLVISNPAAHGLERLEAANSESVFPLDRLDMIKIDLETLKSKSKGDRIKLLPSVEEQIREVEVEASESSGDIGRRRNLMRSYLNSLTIEKKKDLLKVKIDDLWIYFDIVGGDFKRLAAAVLFGALECAKATKNWSVCKCLDCGGKFVNAKLLIQHSLQDHVGNLIRPEVKSLLPKKEWIEVLLCDPPSSSNRGDSDKITSCYLEACSTLALLKIEEGDYGGVEDQSQASKSDFIIAFDSNSSLLVLDDHKLPNGGDVEGFLSSLVDELEERSLPGTCEALRTWLNRIQKAEKPRTLFVSLKTQLALIELDLEGKCEHIIHMKELYALADRYAEESVHAEGDVEFSELFQIVSMENLLAVTALRKIHNYKGSQEPYSWDRFQKAVFRRQMTKAQKELKKFNAELKSKIDHVEQLLYKELVPASTDDL